MATKKKKKKFPRVSLKPIVRKLKQLEKAAAKGKTAAISKGEQQVFAARVTKLRRVEKKLMAICESNSEEGFYI